MQLRQIEVFCKVAELKSFTKAAEALFMTQPGVSFHIRALEQFCGSPLFIRNGREITLSEFGEIFYPYAARALRDLNQGLQEAQAQVASRNPFVRFGVGTNLAISYLLPAMGKFISHIGNIEIKLQTGVSDEIVQGLKENRLDLGLIWGPLIGSGWCTEMAAMEPWMLIFPPESPLGQLQLESKQGIAYLNRTPFVLPATRSTRMFVEKALAQCGVKPKVAMELQNAEAITDAVMNGNGVGLAPWKTIEARVKSGQLGYLPLPSEPKREILVAYQKNNLQQKPYLNDIAHQICLRISTYMEADTGIRPKS